MTASGPTTTCPRLMFIVDPSNLDDALLSLIDAAIDGGCDAIQLRAGGLAPSAMREASIGLQRRVVDRATLVINGHPSIAAGLGLGLHLPEAGMATAEARRLVGPSTTIGRSVHTPAAATAATGADYLLAGHVFPSRSKPGAPPLGIAGFRRIMEASWLPVLAVGGVRVEQIPALVAAGAAGVAVIDAIATAPDPRAAAVALRSAVDAVLPEVGETEEPTPTTVSLTVNGKPVALEPESTITDFLADRGLAGKMVVVELNGKVIARRAFDDTTLAEGDRVEVVHAVGGG